jgi:hypothetical protein
MFIAYQEKMDRKTLQRTTEGIMKSIRKERSNEEACSLLKERWN